MRSFTQEMRTNYDHVFSGALDAFYSPCQYGRLEYRTVRLLKIICQVIIRMRSNELLFNRYSLILGLLSTNIFRGRNMKLQYVIKNMVGM